MGQNLLALSVTAIGMMLDKGGLMLGTTASAAVTNTFLYCVFGVALAFNCAFLLPPFAGVPATYMDIFACLMLSCALLTVLLLVA